LSETSQEGTPDEGSPAQRGADDGFSASDEGSGPISQSDIDALLNGGLDADGSSGGPAEASVPVSGTSEPDEPIAQEAAPGADAVVPEEAFIPQEPDESGDHVSQSDIDALLMEAMASDGDSEGLSSEGADGKVDADIHEHIFSGGIDRLLEEQGGDGSQLEPVILAEETVSADAKAAEPPPSQPWYRKTIWRMTAMAALVMIVSSVGLYGLLRSPEKGAQPTVETFAVPKPDTQTAQANNNGKTDVEMPGFVVLAPDDKSGLTCVTADLFLDFSDSTIAGMVKDNEAFVRNIIYEAISKALVTPDKVKINKINMGLSVRKALATMVPRETIRAVFFNKFEVI
jgi:flagellar basal body-associated protein FliL